MNPIPPTRRVVVLRASRDTLVLIACTVGVTLALSHAVRHRPAPAPEAQQQVWAGQLAGVSPDAGGKAEPMTSESMVVPKATLALPIPPKTGGKTQPCDAPPCQIKAAVPVPPTRQKLAMADPAPAQPARPADATQPKDHDKRFGLSDLNPMRHLPDAVRKPFNYAGTKISGWIDWF